MNHSTMNSSTAENLMRSANAPTIRQQVMPANVAWNAANTISGITTPLLKVAPFGEGAGDVVPDALHEEAVECRRRTRCLR